MQDSQAYHARQKARLTTPELLDALAGRYSAPLNPGGRHPSTLVANTGNPPLPPAATFVRHPELLNRPVLRHATAVEPLRSQQGRRPSTWTEVSTMNSNTANNQSHLFDRIRQTLEYHGHRPLLVPAAPRKDVSAGSWLLLSEIVTQFVQ